MKKTLKKNEYRLLLDLVSLGEYVINSHDIDATPEREKYEEIVQKIYSYAKEFGCEDLIRYEEDIGEYAETRKFDESEKDSYLREFEENNFWDELIHRLAHRDFVNEVGMENIEGLSFAEQIFKISGYEDSYREEFEKHGLDNLIIMSRKKT